MLCTAPSRGRLTKTRMEIVEGAGGTPNIVLVDDSGNSEVRKTIASEGHRKVETD